MHTQDGLKPIEDINVGDLVASKNDITGETDWKRVSQLFINHDKTVFDVTVTTDDDQQEVLGATHEHPFWVEGKGWVKAGELVAGDRVHLRDGQLASISSTKAREGQHTTYNFEVEDFHTYFVGEQGVWVHNTCVDDVAKGALKFTDEILDPALRLGFDPSQVSIKNGVADIPIEFTSEVLRSDIRIVSDTLRANGATNMRVNTGRVINDTITDRIKKASNSGNKFLGFTVKETGDPANMFILEKGL